MSVSAVREDTGGRVRRSSGGSVVGKAGIEGQRFALLNAQNFKNKNNSDVSLPSYTGGRLSSSDLLRDWGFIWPLISVDDELILVVLPKLVTHYGFSSRSIRCMPHP